jgi:hypothetical protein
MRYFNAQFDKIVAALTIIWWHQSIVKDLLTQQDLVSE